MFLINFMSLWRDTKIYYCLTSKQLMGDILRLLTMLFDSRYRRNSYYAIWLLSMGNMLTISFKMGYTSYVLLSMLFDGIYSYYVIWQETYLLYCLTEDVLTMVDVRCTCYVFWSDYTYYVVWWNILLLCHLTGNMLPLLFDGRYLLRCLMWDIIAVGFFFWGGGTIHTMLFDTRYTYYVVWHRLPGPVSCRGCDRRSIQCPESGYTARQRPGPASVKQTSNLQHLIIQQVLVKKSVYTGHITRQYLTETLEIVHAI